jgi:transglutaminase-like putative cysteine protease
VIAGRWRLPSTTAVSLLAALCTWVAFWAWSGFAERPSGYLAPILGGCLLVAVSGALLRSARVPSLLVVGGQLVVLLLWLTHRWAAEQALGGWIPTPSSVDGIGTVLNTSAIAAQAYAAPVPKDVPEFYPLMIAVGVVTAVAVDFLACGLRRVPLAGLPLLAVYTAPVSILAEGVSWWKFAAGAVCFLLLLAADETERLAHWGRQLSSSRIFDSQATTVSTQAVRASARKIGLTATGIAVVVPLAVPTFTIGLFGGEGNGPGPGDAVSITNPMVDLKRDLVRGSDRDLVWVTTRDPDPSHLRISVLDSFDGEAWRPSGRDIPVTQRANGPVVDPPGLDAEIPRNEIPWQIRIGPDFDSRWLPTPYPVASIHAKGDWRYDTRTLDFISAVENRTAAGLAYRLRALNIHYSVADLASAGPAATEVYSEFTSLPKSLPDSIRVLARRLTESEKSRFEKAVRLQQWFRSDGGFHYSLQPDPGNGVDALTRFLRTKTGYCEQFAAAMAIMGRAIGIPSRVAVGFLDPQQVGAHTYVYSSHDMHAWPEMYFEGTGWVRFEPTPPIRASNVPPYTTQNVPVGGPDALPTTSAPLPQQNNRIDQPHKGADSATHHGGKGGGLGGDLLLALLVAAAVAGVVLLPRGARSWVRRRRWSSARTPAELAEAAWSELRASARDLALGWDDSVTLRTRARDLVRSFGAAPDATSAGPRSRARARGASAAPEAAEALDRLVRVVERSRFARSVGVSDVVRDQVMRDVERCVTAMRHGATRGQRLRATWLPGSLLSGWVGATGQGRRQEITATPGVDHAV